MAKATKDTDIWGHSPTSGAGNAAKNMHCHQLDLACCIQEMFSHRETILEIKEVVRESEHGAGHKVVDVRDVEQESTTPHHIVIGGSRSQYYNLQDVIFKLPDGFFEVYD